MVLWSENLREGVARETQTEVFGSKERGWWWMLVELEAEWG